MKVRKTRPSSTNFDLSAIFSAPARYSMVIYIFIFLFSSTHRTSGRSGRRQSVFTMRHAILESGPREVCGSFWIFHGHVVQRTTTRNKRRRPKLRTVRVRLLFGVVFLRWTHFHVSITYLKIDIFPFFYSSYITYELYYDCLQDYPSFPYT